MGRKKNDTNEMLMHATWLATTACCTALHDIGFDTEEIAEVMPDAMKHLGDEIIEKCYIGKQVDSLRFLERVEFMLAGDAIRFGQEHAERLAASRAGVQS